MDIRGIIFDWDGVLVDSMPSLAKGMQEVAARYGVRISVDYILDNYFQPREEFYKSVGVKTQDVEELIRVHLETMSKYQGGARLFSDVERPLKSLIGKFSLGIVSANVKEIIVSKLAKFGLSEIFESKYVIGGEKHKEEKLNIAAEVFGFEKDNLLYVGDLPSDVQVAKIVGMKSAGLGRSASSIERLGKESPDYLINSLDGLAEKINGS